MCWSRQVPDKTALLVIFPVLRLTGQKPAGDKVMQAKDYDKKVYNGDIGYVDDVEPEDGEFTASFELGHTEADVIKNVTGRRISSPST
jgi:ATP-dependent exoDNAse (exonuclease V) alpha subunit